MSNISVTFRDKEVQNPVLRILIGISAIFMVLLGVVLMIISLFIIIPLSIPVHFLLRVCGRAGFTDHHSDGTFSYNVTTAGFHKSSR
jgi:hypothetical protein